MSKLFGGEPRSRFTAIEAAVDSLPCGSFVRTVTAVMMSVKGDLLPVPFADGAWPVGTPSRGVLSPFVWRGMIVAAASLAFDHSECVTGLAVLDVVPSETVWQQADAHRS